MPWKHITAINNVGCNSNRIPSRYLEHLTLIRNSFCTICCRCYFTCTMIITVWLVFTHLIIINRFSNSWGRELKETKSEKQTWIKSLLWPFMFIQRLTSGWVHTPRRKGRCHPRPQWAFTHYQCLPHPHEEPTPPHSCNDEMRCSTDYISSFLFLPGAGWELLLSSPPPMGIHSLPMPAPSSWVLMPPPPLTPPHSCDDEMRWVHAISLPFSFMQALAGSYS